MTVYYLVSMCTIHSLFMYSQLPMQRCKVTVYPTVYAIWIAIHKPKSCHGSVSSCCIWQLNGTQAFPSAQDDLVTHSLFQANNDKNAWNGSR